MDNVEKFDTFFLPFEKAAYQKSLNDRSFDESDLSFSFGQVDVNSWKQILELIEIKPHTSLIDLGSGAGKAAMSAAYLFKDLHVTGIELLPSLFQWGQHILKMFSENLSSEAGLRVQLICNDFFNCELEAFQTILVNPTTFNDTLLEKLILLLKKAAPETTIISIGRALKAPYLNKLLAGAWKMGWQPEGQKIAVFVYKKQMIEVL
jgi:SAM-dependent methyltransferase